MLNYLYSIHPQPTADILNLRKTAELRTRIPREMKETLDRGEKVIMWIYCTKNGLTLNDMNGIQGELPYRFVATTDHYNGRALNGLVVAKCVVEKITVIDDAYYVGDSMLEKSCVSYEEMNAYANGRPLYALHLTQVEILDKPLQVSEFLVKTTFDSVQKMVNTDFDKAMKDYFTVIDGDTSFYYVRRLDRAPQSCQRVLAPEGD